MSPELYLWQKKLEYKCRTLYARKESSNPGEVPGVQLVGGGSPVGFFPPDLPGFVAAVLKETGQTPVSVNDAWKVITAASELS